MQSLYSAAVIWVIIGLISAFIARKKGRNPFLWFVIGTFFSILGLLFLILLPKEKTPEEKSALAPVRSMNSESALPAEEGFHDPTPPAKRIKPNTDLAWHYIYEKDDVIEVRGPFFIDQLRKELISNRLSTETYVWNDELLDWTQLKEFQNPSYVLDKDLIIDEGDETKYDNPSETPFQPDSQTKTSD